MAAWGEEPRQGIIMGQEGTQRQRVSITLVMVMATQVTIPHTYQIAPLNLSSYITPTPTTLPLLPVVNPKLLANALGRATLVLTLGDFTGTQPISPRGGDNDNEVPSELSRSLCRAEGAQAPSHQHCARGPQKRREESRQAAL